MPEPVRACVFDAYGTLLDINSTVAKSSASIGENTDACRPYGANGKFTWILSLMKRYADFWKITEDALEYALNILGFDGSPGLKESLMNSYLKLDAYPEVANTLRELKSLGMTTAILSNETPSFWLRRRGPRRSSWLMPAITIKRRTSNSSSSGCCITA